MIAQHSDNGSRAEQIIMPNCVCSAVKFTTCLSSFVLLNLELP